MVSWMFEKSCFRTPFWSQRVNGSQTLLKFARRCFYANFPLISDKSRTETSLLVRSEILGQCFNKFPADHIYSHLNREIFPQLIRMHLPQKRKTFSGISIAFFESTSNFSHFDKKDKLHSLNNLEVTDTKECGFLNARKLVFHNTLLKSTT